jgi:Sulfotransferase family
VVVDEPAVTAGPRWVGIGAQRCGTTWLVDLLCQHPDVSLIHPAGKELHYFQRFLVDDFKPSDAQLYRSLFTGPCAGEFTPGYLRWPWVAPLLEQSCGPEAVLIVLLRDPVDRFASAMRRHLEQLKRGRSRKLNPMWIADRGTDAMWGGMYARQLGAWTEIFGRDRILVEQYERVVADPTAAVSRIWERLGLPPGPALRRTERTSWTATNTGRDWPELHAMLGRLYQPEVEALARDWGIDPDLWRSL